MNLAKSITIKSLTLILITLLTSCTTFGPPPAEQLLGTWQTEIGGFPVTLEYNETSVTIGDNEAVTYQLDGDRLSFANGGEQVRILSFDGGDQMSQLDPLTGTTHRFSRLN